MTANQKSSFKFIKQLSELISSGMTLRESLKLMSEAVKAGWKDNNVTLAAKEIYALLEGGSFLSSAMLACSAIKFDRAVIAFVATSEQTGMIKETVDFLRQRAERKEKASSRIVSALLYPLFIVAITLAGGFAFVFFGNTIASFAYSIALDDYKRMAIAGIARSALFLCAVLVFCAYLLFRISECETESDVFSALDFLTSANVHLSYALDSALVVANGDSQIGKKLFIAKTRIDSGVPPDESFAGIFDNWTSQLLYISCKTGNEKKMFSTANVYISQRNELYWKRLLSFAEPFFIGVAGICLLIVISSTVLPLMSNIGFDF